MPPKRRWNKRPALAARALVACLALSLNAPAAAQDTSSSNTQDASSLDEEARALFESATMAFDSGRHEVALTRFREALELSGRATLYYNIGIAADRLRRNGEALEAFRAYLNGVPNARNRADVEARVRVLEETVAREQAALDAQASEPQTTVPSPEETASSSLDDQTVSAEPHEDSDEENTPITKQWWFWTVVGVVVLGSVGVGVGGRS